MWGSYPLNTSHALFSAALQNDPPEGSALILLVLYTVCPFVLKSTLQGKYTSHCD